MIRLARAGVRKKPFYRVVVTEKRSARDSNFVEDLGFFDQLAKGDTEPMRIDLEGLEKRVGQGARLSPRVASLVKRYKVYLVEHAKKVKEEERIRVEKEKKAAAKAKEATEEKDEAKKATKASKSSVKGSGGKVSTKSESKSKKTTGTKAAGKTATKAPAAKSATRSKSSDSQSTPQE